MYNDCLLASDARKGFLYSTRFIHLTILRRYFLFQFFVRSNSWQSSGQSFWASHLPALPWSLPRVPHRWFHHGSHLIWAPSSTSSSTFWHLSPSRQMPTLLTCRLPIGILRLPTHSPRTRFWTPCKKRPLPEEPCPANMSPRSSTFSPLWSVVTWNLECISTC